MREAQGQDPGAALVGEASSLALGLHPARAAFRRRPWISLPAPPAALLLPRAAFGHVGDFVRESEEVAGVLAGFAGPERRLVITRLLPLARGTAGAFALSIERVLAAAADLRDDERGGRECLVGLFHTHPKGGAGFSFADLSYFSLFRWCWLVAAAGSGTEPGPSMECLVRTPCGSARVPVEVGSFS